jgi:hypothetical protein
MLEYTYRYNIMLGKAGAFRDWLLANDEDLHDHQPPGWTYLGTWFAVRGFGDFGCEGRFQIESYEALGSGFGDDEAQRLVRELFEDFIDWTTRPVATLYRSASEVRIPKSM